MDKGSRAAARREARLPSGWKGALAAVLSWPLATGFRLIPARHRVGAVLRLSIPVACVGRALGRGSMTSGLTVRDRVIGRLLSMLHYRGVTYPADVSVVSDDGLDGPLLLLVRHSLLNQLLISRLVYDGRPLTLVMSHLAGHVRTFGGNQRIDVLGPSTMVLRAMTGRLEAGRILVVAIDGTMPSPGLTRVDTSTGPLYLATQPIRLAIKMGAPMAVAVHDIRGGTLVSHIRRLVQADVAGIVAQYCDTYGIVVTR